MNALMKTSPRKRKTNQPSIRKKSGLNSRKSIFQRQWKTPLKSMLNLFSSSINASDPDLVVTGLTIGRFSLLDNQFFAPMLDRLNCPAIVARAFVIPGVSRIRGILISLLRRVLDRVKG